jgi:hypothetical protein
MKTQRNEEQEGTTKKTYGKSHRLVDENGRLLELIDP